MWAAEVNQLFINSQVHCGAFRLATGSATGEGFLGQFEYTPQVGKRGACCLS